MEYYGFLKSGTDIRGRAIGVEGRPAVLTDAAVSDLSRAFALWLTRRTGKARLRIAIGRDSRLTGERFTRAIITALKEAGLELYDCGLFSTPAAYLVTKFPSVMADGAIMITASHHPKEINGLKFFTADGGVNSDELNEIIALAEEGATLPRTTNSTLVKRDCLRLYCDTLTEAIRKGTNLFLPLKGMKIVVDAGHGAGGFFAKRVLEPLGADISGSQFLEPDGSFPAHAPNPENAEAMQSLRDRVLETNADLGVIFDADVDRAAIVASDGTEINRSRLIALAAALVLPEHPGATIVTDSVTTAELKKTISAFGGVQHRFKRGYRNVIDEAKRLGNLGVDAPLAIESSGHAAFIEHYFLDDGAYFIAKILVAFSQLRRDGGDITDLIAQYSDPFDMADVRLNFTDKNFRPLAEKIITRLHGFCERSLKLWDDNYEGVRAFVPYARGNFLVRTSVHDPVMPIYIEGDNDTSTLKIARLLYSFLSGYEGLDCAPLAEFIDEREIALGNKPKPPEQNHHDYYEAVDESVYESAYREEASEDATENAFDEPTTENNSEQAVYDDEASDVVTDSGFSEQAYDEGVAENEFGAVEPDEQF